MVCSYFLFVVGVVAILPRILRQDGNLCAELREFVKHYLALEAL